MTAVLHLLDVFRIGFGGRPLLLWLVAAALIAATRPRRDRRQSSGLRVIVERVTVVVAVGASLAYAAVAAWYASIPQFFDNAEPTVTSIAWLYRVGLPIYHATDSPERYAHIYGPFAFMVHAWALAAFGPGILVSKAVGAAAGTASLGIVYLLALSSGTRLRAVALTGVYALLLLLFRNYSFWTRPDSLELLSVALSLLVATRTRGLVSALLLGAVAGVASNLKLTGVLYILPAFAILWSRSGVGRAIVAAVAGGAVAAAPFALMPNVSLRNYAAWLSASGQTGLMLSTLRQNLEWSAYVLLPILLAYMAIPAASRGAGGVTREWCLTLGALLLGIGGVAVAASKPGAGPYHLLPFFPVVIYLVAVLLAHTGDSDATMPVATPWLAWVAVAVLIAVAQQAQFISTVTTREGTDDAADIGQFAATHTGVVEMGYGTSEVLSLERPILVFRNRSYFIDQPAVREHQLQGIEVPAPTIHALEACRVNWWLVPKGELPFSGRNVYPQTSLRPLFPEEFRAAFERSHRRVGVTRYYDVWQCVGLAGT